MHADMIKGLIGSATGQAKLLCDAGGKCAIKLEGLPIAQIDAQCVAGECLAPTSNELNVTVGACACVCVRVAGWRWCVVGVAA